jgi:hypothetical protein
LDKKDTKDFIKRKLHQMIKLIDRREERKAIGHADLDDQASDGRNPVSKVGDAGESIRQTSFASSGRDEADNSDLVVDSVVDVVQWTTRVTLYIVSSI